MNADSTIFAVVGSHREDPDQLLLLDERGQHYAMRNVDAHPVPVEPVDHQDWEMDTETNADDLWL